MQSRTRMAVPYSEVEAEAARVRNAEGFLARLNGNKRRDAPFRNLVFAATVVGRTRALYQPADLLERSKAQRPVHSLGTLEVNAAIECCSHLVLEVIAGIQGSSELDLLI
jgi:hypothetical protein